VDERLARIGEKRNDNSPAHSSHAASGCCRCSVARWEHRAYNGWRLPEGDACLPAPQGEVACLPYRARHRLARQAGLTRRILDFHRQPPDSLRQSTHQPGFQM